MAEREQLISKWGFGPETGRLKEFELKQIDLVIVPVTFGHLPFGENQEGKRSFSVLGNLVPSLGEPFPRTTLASELVKRAPDLLIASSFVATGMLASKVDERFLPYLEPAGIIVDLKGQRVTQVLAAIDYRFYHYLLNPLGEEREIPPQEGLPPYSAIDQEILREDQFSWGAVELVGRRIAYLERVGRRFRELGLFQEGPPGWLSLERLPLELKKKPELLQVDELLYCLASGFKLHLVEFTRAFPEESDQRAVVDYFLATLPNYWTRALVYTVLVGKSQFGDKEKFSPARFGDLPEEIENWDASKTLIYLLSFAELLNEDSWYQTEEGGLIAFLRYAHPLLPRKIQVGEVALERFMDFYLQTENGKPLASPREIFDALGAEYDKRVLLRLKDFVFQRLIENVTAQGEKEIYRLLDAGVGTGQLKLRGEKLGFLPEGTKIYGVDVSPAMVEIAQRRGIEAKLANLEEEVPFEDGFFDAVVCSFVLGIWEQDEEAIFKELFRVLTEGGYMSFNVRRPKTGWEEHYSQLLRNCGFEEISFDSAEAKVEVAGHQVSIPVGFVTARKPELKEVK